MEDLKFLTEQQHLLAVEALREEIEAARPISKEVLVPLTVARTVQQHDGFLGMHYARLSNLEKKDAATNRPASYNPFLHLPPQQIIKELNSTHRLLFNGFNLYPDHLLLITKEFRSQKEKLTKEDITHAALACEAVKGLFFFNGGEKSGATQPHKHLQVLPQEARSFPIFAELYQYVKAKENQLQKNEIIRFEKFNFLHGIVPILAQSPFRTLGDRLHEAYQVLHGQLIGKKQKGNEQGYDYNMIACDKFMLLVVRKQAKAFEKLSISSLVYLGWLLFKEDHLMQEFLSLHPPSSVLQSISSS